jgi:amino acid adenylation domain-containing protein
MNMDGRHLSHLLEHAAAECPERIAVESESSQHLTYSELRQAADRVATRLSRWGVGPGDRVGLWLPKGLEVVAAIHGILKAGAAYVPVDPTGPALRTATILSTSGVKAAIVSAELAQQLRAAWPDTRPLPRLIIVENSISDVSPPAVADSDLETADSSWSDVMTDDAPSPLLPDFREDDLAYILFTSGSTGQPKGVMLSHENAFCFLDWCHQSLDPWPAGERFASHAPLHFDLSIFDLFGACQQAGTLVLVGETLSKDPARLAQFITERRIDVWYSAPSILSLMACHGELDRPSSHMPRLVLFAGEVFPIAMLRRLRQSWPAATMWNLYGPTETNVCTAYRIPQSIPDDQTEPFPIGLVCEPNKARVIDELGNDVDPGRLGELIIAGPSVMCGYFGQAELTDAAMFEDENGERWYRTGDLVLDDGEGCYQFHGRRDRMVKKRGYRIELGEIESALYRHDGVDRAGVVARADDAGVSIAAFVSLKPDRKKSIIAMKRHCTLHLPNYMIPDTITFVDALPATSTDKVDYQRLRIMAAD